MDKYPELFTDKEIDELVEAYYYVCKKINCNNCIPRNEICRMDILFELWRKWKNSLMKIQKYNEENKENE